jgi:vacuolar-type H+-ATPase subunit E/Vma4
MSNRGSNANRPVAAVPGAVAVTESPEEHQRRMNALEAEAAKEAAQAEKDRLAAVQEAQKNAEAEADRLRQDEEKAANAAAEEDQPRIEEGVERIENAPDLVIPTTFENREVPSPAAQGQVATESVQADGLTTTVVGGKGR